MKNKKKNYKQDEVIEKKVKTMEKGKQYYKAVEKNEDLKENKN